jgi:endonuclease/exonuclease/phosphatase family metal-dependent hydrolase
VKVMTWNIWWRFGPWEQRLPAIIDTVRTEAPDVLMLQEVWSADGTSAAQVTAEALGFHVALTDDPFAERRAAHVAGGGAGFHNAIVSRWPLLDVHSHPLPGATGAPGHRRVLTAAVELPSGRWPIACTHLDHRFDESAVRQLQAAELLRIVAGVRGDTEREPPVIVGGDVNAVPDSDEVRMLTGRTAAPVPGVVLSDAWEHVGEGLGATWRADNPYQASSAWPNRRLDYVFVSWPRPKPLGNPVRAHLAGLEPPAGSSVHPSDHAAVVVEILDTVAPR